MKSVTMTENDNGWFVYIIRASDNSLYTGITTNVKRRWRQHCGELKGGAKYFNGRKPKDLAFIERQPDRSSASIREVQLKKLSRKQKDSLIQTENNKVSDFSNIIPVSRE